MNIFEVMEVAGILIELKKVDPVAFHNVMVLINEDSASPILS